MKNFGNNGISKFALIGMGAGILGAIASALSAWVDRRQTEEYIDQKITERIGLLEVSDDEDDEEDDED